MRRRRNSGHEILSQCFLASHLRVASHLMPASRISSFVLLVAEGFPLLTKLPSIVEGSIPNKKDFVRTQSFSFMSHIPSPLISSLHIFRVSHDVRTVQDVGSVTWATPSVTFCTAASSPTSSTPLANSLPLEPPLAVFSTVSPPAALAAF